VIGYCELLEARRKFVISRQLLKSGTAIGANCIEAQNSESRSDFIHKFKIAAKEAEETQYWLLLCDESKEYPDCTYLLKKVEALNKIIGKILSSSKRNYLLKLFNLFFIL
jgi:four helix bundle protein